MKSNFQALLFMGLVCTSVSCKQQISPNTPQVQGGLKDASEDTTSKLQSHEEATTAKSSYSEIVHPDQSKVDEILRKSSVSVLLSWHNGISLPSASGTGWDNNLTLDQLKNRLETIEEKQQAAIILEKNFSGENKEDEAITELLMQIGFETIVIQTSHSSSTIIDKIIKRSK